jgi:type 1 glutamine amidotransferase
MRSPKKPGFALAAVLALCAILLVGAGKKQAFEIASAPTPPKVLVFSKTAGFHHASIPDGLDAIKKLGQENNFMVDATTDAALFEDDKLKAYAAVVFLNTTGNVLNNEQQAAFERYIQAGGGFAGVHAAADTEYDWPWYNKLLGAYFLSHPAQQTAVIDIKDKNHPSTAMLPDRWERYDEWYNFKSMMPDIRVIATLDETTYRGGTHGENHPIAWYHTMGCGRAWYTALGHTSESYREPLFLQHLLGGIQYAISNGQACAALPVVLAAFTASVNRVWEVALTWQTAAEQNTDYFVVEQSADPVSFNAIGTVKANGYPSTYSFQDGRRQRSLQYYRLRQVDKDGAVQYSSVVAVSLPQSLKVSISPNPSSGIVQIITGGHVDEQVPVQVMDRAGKSIYRKQYQGPRFTLDLSRLPSGAYVIRVGEVATQLLLTK